MTGWVKVKAPAGIFVQVGINSGDKKTLSSLGNGGGSNLFSAWMVEPSIELDTVFYLTNHTDQDLDVPIRFNGINPPNETPVKVPAFSMVQAPASAYVGG